MIPVVGVASSLEICRFKKSYQNSHLNSSLELGSHGDNSVGHSLDVSAELLVQDGVVEDLFCDSSTVSGRVRVHWSDQDL